MNIRATELFPFAQYGGSYTGGYHQADWEKDKWLTKEAENFPLQYEVTTQKSNCSRLRRERFKFRNSHCLPKTKCVQCPLWFRFLSKDGMAFGWLLCWLLVNKFRKNLSRAEKVFDLGRDERKQFCSVGTGCPVTTKIRQLSLAS